jgi:thymidylate synthase
MSEGFPLLTTKKMYFKGIVTELLWFLRGDTNIKYLVDNNCHIWDGDAYKKYHTTWEMDTYGVLDALSQEGFINKIKTNRMFAFEWGELGPVYGKQWRSWGGRKEKYQQKRSYGGSFGGPTHVEYGELVEYDVHGVDQIQNLIRDLKTNPDSRRLMVNAWNVGELGQMTLPPCHYGFQVYTRELSLEERTTLYFENYGYDSVNMEGNDLTGIPTRAISLMWNQRSVDTFLGLPFNIASYGLLLEIIAKAVNMVPDELIGNLGDVHLYSNHIEQAKEQIGIELTDEDRYNIWFNNNYETGMEKFFDPNNLPNFEDSYYEPTPNRTREPYPLPKLVFGKTYEFFKSLGEDLSLITHLDSSDFEIEGYQSHPVIKAPLSN